MRDFQSLCQQRRSYRKYTNQPVEQEKLDYIIRCALMSPAGKRMNPWRFVVITNQDILRQLAGCRTYGSGMDTSVIDTWQCDAAIAAQNIWLAAADQGLGACWCHVYQREGAEDLVRKLTNLPEDFTVLCVMSLGYKNEERKPFDFEKLQYDKVVQID